MRHVITSLLQIALCEEFLFFLFNLYKHVVQIQNGLIRMTAQTSDFICRMTRCSALYLRVNEGPAEDSTRLRRMMQHDVNFESVLDLNSVQMMLTIIAFPTVLFHAKRPGFQKLLW
jgi:hypothetical protein